MGRLYEIAMEVAKGIEEVYLNSSKTVDELVEEGIDLIKRGIEKNE
ncbi:hypothetical protein R9X47_02260 [Wukongibacter baidiensis]